MKLGEQQPPITEEYEQAWKLLKVSTNMIRTKFKCTTITEYESTFTYRFNVVYGSAENKVYWEFTPSGTVELSIVREKGKLFEVGKEYLFDIVPASEVN